MRHAPTHRCGWSEHGFTLLELMIAAAVFAVVATVIVSSFTTALTSIERTRRWADVSQMARLVMDRMLLDLTSTFFINEEERYRFAGQDGRKEEASGPILSFVTVAPRRVLGGTLPGGLARVEYFLSAHPDAPEETILYRRETSLLADTEADAGQAAILGEELRDLRLEYYDAAGTSYSAWDSADAEGERSLPVAVRITLVLGGVEPGHVYTTMVPIP